MAAAQAQACCSGTCETHNSSPPPAPSPFPSPPTHHIRPPINPDPVKHRVFLLCIFLHFFPSSSFHPSPPLLHARSISCLQFFLFPRLFPLPVDYACIWLERFVDAKLNCPPWPAPPLSFLERTLVPRGTTTENLQAIHSSTFSAILQTSVRIVTEETWDLILRCLLPLAFTPCVNQQKSWAYFSGLVFEHPWTVRQNSNQTGIPSLQRLHCPSLTDLLVSLLANIRTFTLALQQQKVFSVLHRAVAGHNQSNPQPLAALSFSPNHQSHVPAPFVGTGTPLLLNEPVIR